MEKGTAIHSSIPAWETPWTEEPGGLYSSWGREDLEMTEHKTHTYTYNQSIRCT